MDERNMSEVLGEIVDEEEKEYRNSNDERCALHVLNRANECVSMMKMARNDTDRLAVLALIPKLINIENADQSIIDKAMDLVAKSIPIDFMERLLDTDDQNSQILAIRVLSRLLSSESVVQSGKFNALLPRVLGILERSHSTPDLTEIMDDTLFCCSKLSTSTSGSQYFQLFSQMVKTGPNPSRIMDAAFSVFESSCKRGDFGQVESGMNDFLNALLIRIKDDQTRSHFDMLTQLCHWLLSFNDIPKPQQEHWIQLGPWTKDLRDIIRNILQSRGIGDRERRLAITLASAMCSIFGSSWFHGDSKFLQLLTSMASIDIQMWLQDHADQDLRSLDDDHLYVTRCCQLLEIALQYAADYEESEEESSQLTQSQALQINNTLVELTNYLLEYIGSHELPDQLLYPLYRYVCAYLAEGLALVNKDHLVSASKPMLTLIDRAMSEQDQQVDVMALILPALSELMDMDDREWTDVKKAFKDIGLVRIMKKYAQKHNDVEDMLKRWMDV